MAFIRTLTTGTLPLLARIRPALGPDDVAAHLGGDEFAVLIEGAHEAETAGAWIAGALGERFTVEGIELRLAASIGIALFPEHGDDAETLLQRADVAMYQAKARRSGAEFYSRERDLHSRERLQLIGELRDAVAQDRLTVHYQAKLDIGRGRINGVEDGDTLRRLADYGIDVAQGYHIARPMPAADVEPWLAAGGFQHEDVEGPGAVDAFDAIQLDVGRRARA